MCFKCQLKALDYSRKASLNVKRVEVKLEIYVLSTVFVINWLEQSVSYIFLRTIYNQSH